ncbi:MAG: hypothetical protein J6U64_03235, partial [Alphaproteobacteria bacterium]|nr:hypothetical protein [Alphaproteobacteria bacterium]
MNIFEKIIQSCAFIRKKQVSFCHLTDGKQRKKSLMFEGGRSKWEIIAVLVLIFLLSLLGVVFLGYLSNKWKANDTVRDVMLRAANVATQYASYDPKDYPEEFVFKDLGDKGTHQYPIKTRKEPNNSDFVYHVEVSNVSKEVCRSMLAMRPPHIDYYTVNMTAEEAGKRASMADCNRESNTLYFYFETIGEVSSCPNVSCTKPCERLDPETCQCVPQCGSNPCCSCGANGCGPSITCPAGQVPVLSGSTCSCTPCQGTIVYDSFGCASCRGATCIPCSGTCEDMQVGVDASGCPICQNTCACNPSSCLGTCEHMQVGTDSRGCPICRNTCGGSGNTGGGEEYIPPIEWGEGGSGTGTGGTGSGSGNTGGGLIPPYEGGDNE